MKKLVKILALAMLFALAFSIGASATGVQNEEIKAFVSEKIIPVIAGVLTSLVALLGTLKSIFKSLKDLKGTRDGLCMAQREIKDQSAREHEAMQKKYEEIKELVSSVPELRGEMNELLKNTNTLILQLSRLSKISSLGFCGDSETVKSGRGKEIALLAEQNQEVEK